MSFENPFSGISKKIKNVGKIGALAALGALPMAANSAEDPHAGKESQKTEADSAKKMISEDTEAHMQGNKEYYYSYFSGLSHEQIDSLMSGADQKVAGNEAKDEPGAEKSGVRLLTNDQKELLKVLYPDQFKNDPDFKGRWITPSAELVERYKKGEFKTKEELIKLNELAKK